MHSKDLLFLLYKENNQALIDLVYITLTKSTKKSNQFDRWQPNFWFNDSIFFKTLILCVTIHFVPSHSLIFWYKQCYISHGHQIIGHFSHFYSQFLGSHISIFWIATLLSCEDCTLMPQQTNVSDVSGNFHAFASRGLPATKPASFTSKTTNAVPHAFVASNNCKTPGLFRSAFVGGKSHFDHILGFFKLKPNGLRQLFLIIAGPSEIFLFLKLKPIFCLCPRNSRGGGCRAHKWNQLEAVPGERLGRKCNHERNQE